MTTLALAEIAIAIRTLVALVFLLAAIGKLRQWEVFRGVIANYRLLPEWSIAPVSYLLPPVEAILGLGLLSAVAAPWPETTAAGLLILFAVAMGTNLVRGRRDIDCGCFQSALKQTLSWTLVIRNGVLALLVSMAGAWSSAAADLRAWSEGLLVGGVLFILLQSLNILWSIVPAWRLPRRADSAVAP